MFYLNRNWVEWENKWSNWQNNVCGPFEIEEVLNTLQEPLATGPRPNVWPRWPPDEGLAQCNSLFTPPTQTRQNCLVLSCRQLCSHHRKDSFVSSRPSFQFATNSSFTPPTRKRQYSFVWSVWAVWTSHKCALQPITQVCQCELWTSVIWFNVDVWYKSTDVPTLCVAWLPPPLAPNCKCYRTATETNQ